MNKKREVALWLACVVLLNYMYFAGFKQISDTNLIQSAYHGLVTWYTQNKKFLLEKIGVPLFFTVLVTMFFLDRNRPK